MSNEKRRKRRVVSRHAYVSFLCKKVGWMSAVAIASVVVFAATGLFVYMCMQGQKPMTYDEEAGNMWFSVISLVCIGVFMFGAFAAGEQAKTIEPVVPLTRHNAGDLPEDESLVRASEEPPTHQADVLLRAAQGNRETPEEQLLRPVKE